MTLTLRRMGLGIVLFWARWLLKAWRLLPRGEWVWTVAGWAMLAVWAFVVPVLLLDVIAYLLTGITPW